MNFLAICTASKSTLIAMCVNGVEKTAKLEFSRHSENLFPLLDKALNENGFNLNDFDVFSCVVGPGSFTGIRIGLSVIKGFAFALNKPVVAINSLELLAYSRLNADKPIVSVINAGAGLVYNQVFESLSKNGVKYLSPKTQPRLDKIKHFTGFLHSNFSDNVDLIYNHNEEKSQSFADLLSESQDFELSSLINATKAKISLSQFTNSVEVTPLYLRVSQAEQNAKDLEFVKATKQDLTEILKLENQDDDWDLPWSEISINQSFDNPNYECFLIKTTDEVLGLISIMRLPDEAEILRVIVLKKARLMGLGQKLLECLVARLRAEGIKSIFLEVNNENYPALSLYQKAGFKEVGRRADYYEVGQDAIIMKLDL